MKKANIIVVTVIVLAILGALGALSLPVPDTWTGNAREFYTAVGNSIIYTTLHAGAAILFLMGRKAYKEKLRRAYLVLAFSVVLIGAGLAQLTVLNAYGLYDTAWAERGGIVLPFLLAGAAMYLGVRSMARLVGVRSAESKFAVTIPVVLGGVLLSTVLPHAAIETKELYFDIGNAILAWDVIIYGLSIVLVTRMKERMGAHYAEATTWLRLGFICSFTITAVALTLTLLGQVAGSVLLDSLVIVGGFVYLNAGYKFVKTTEV